MVQLGYFFRTAALASRTPGASPAISLLSYSKNTGLSGELRLMSSSEADAMRSSRSGSGGTMVGSATGSGGAGGRPPVDGDEGGAAPGGGIARATGGFLPPHAEATTVNTTRTASAARSTAD